MTTATPPLLVPGPLRRPVTLLVAVAAVAFGILAARYAGTSTASQVDTRVDAVVDPVGAAHHWLVRHTAALGSPPSVVALAFALSALCLLLGRRRLAVLAVVGPGLTGVCTTLLKPVLGRTIEGGFAFPSGHTGGATALGLVTALLVISLVRPGWVGGITIVAAGGILCGGIVGTAMVASNSHYPTDTVGGFCIAVVMVCGAALVLDRVAAYRALRT
jgi:membrane-associated phospholipid phosphatase